MFPRSIEATVRREWEASKNQVGKEMEVENNSSLNWISVILRVLRPVFDIATVVVSVYPTKVSPKSIEITSTVILGASVTVRDASIIIWLSSGSLLLIIKSAR